MPKHRQCGSVVKKFALPARLRANTYHQPRCTEGLQQTSETPNQVAAEPVASWFIMYPWLHYCIEHKAILCVSAFCQFSLDVVYGFTTTMSVHMYCCCFTGSIWNCDSAGFQFCVERTLCLQNSSCETKLSTSCVGVKVGMSPLAGDTDTLWHVIYHSGEAVCTVLYPVTVQYVKVMCLSLFPGFRKIVWISQYLPTPESEASSCCCHIRNGS